jgi:hypothetical protein
MPRLHQPGGMVANMPMVIVRARKPNRKIVILAMGPPLNDWFAVQMSAHRIIPPVCLALEAWSDSQCEAYHCFNTAPGLTKKYGSDEELQRGGSG